MEDYNNCGSIELINRKPEGSWRSSDFRLAMPNVDIVPVKLPVAIRLVNRYDGIIESAVTESVEQRLKLLSSVE